MRLHSQAWRLAQPGRRLNLAECEFSVLGRQCLDRRLPDLATVASEVPAWTETQNQSNQPVDWRFTTEDARIKLKRLYPILLDEWTTRMKSISDTAYIYNQLNLFDNFPAVPKGLHCISERHGGRSLPLRKIKMKLSTRVSPSISGIRQASTLSRESSSVASRCKLPTPDIPFRRASISNTMA